MTRHSPCRARSRRQGEALAGEPPSPEEETARKQRFRAVFRGQRGFSRLRRERIQIIFCRGVYVAKNTFHIRIHEKQDNRLVFIAPTARWILMRRTDAQSAAVPIKIFYFNGRVVSRSEVRPFSTIRPKGKAFGAYC